MSNQTFKHFGVLRSNSLIRQRAKYFFLTLQTPCSSYPCKNGGKCVPNYSDDQYQCDCSPGYDGDHCETGKLQKRNEEKDLVFPSPALPCQDKFEDGRDCIALREVRNPLRPLLLSLGFYLFAIKKREKKNNTKRETNKRKA